MCDVQEWICSLHRAKEIVIVYCSNDFHRVHSTQQTNTAVINALTLFQHELHCTSILYNSALRRCEVISVCRFLPLDSFLGPILRSFRVHLTAIHWSGAMWKCTLLAVQCSIRAINSISTLTTKHSGEHSICQIFWDLRFFSYLLRAVLDTVTPKDFQSNGRNLSIGGLFSVRILAGEIPKGKLRKITLEWW